MMLRPWLWIPTELAHGLSHHFLKSFGQIGPRIDASWEPVTWKGLSFRSPLGIAAGVDKTADQVQGWWNFGAGFIEVGTIVPKAQAPNPGRILIRNFEQRTLWNKMGFPSPGASEVKTKLQKLPASRPTPLFINIGKNRNTPNENATEDYSFLVREFDPLADAFVINISSPNTTNLRDLQNPANLEGFLKNIVSSSASQRPFLLKLSPDLAEGQLEPILETSARAGISGWILTNTTTERKNSVFPTEGGLSGAAVQALAVQALKKAVSWRGPDRNKFLVVSCGGILSAVDAFDRLEMGADLLQCYSVLVFEGPLFFKKVAVLASQRKQDA